MGGIKAYRKTTQLSLESANNGFSNRMHQIWNATSPRQKAIIGITVSVLALIITSIVLIVLGHRGNLGMQAQANLCLCDCYLQNHTVVWAAPTGAAGLVVVIFLSYFAINRYKTHRTKEILKQVD